MERDSSGYTLIEVMMALTVLAIGAGGIYSLQFIAITGNKDANDLTAAANLGRSWVDAIKSDAQQWTEFGPAPPSNLGNSTLLAPLVAAGGAWANLDAAPFSTALTPQRTDGAQDASGTFCTEARARPPLPPIVGVVPPVNGFEVTVRVWWRKSEGAIPDCAVSPANNDLATWNFFYLATMIFPNPMN